MKKTTALAATAAALFLANAPVMALAGAKEAKVHCEGVNACKGQGACKAASHECNGQNGCKGQGFLEMTQAQCDAAKSQAKAAEQPK